MNRIQRPIMRNGPFVEVVIGPSALIVQALKQQGRIAPQSIQAKGLLDTGATRTTIGPSLARQLQLVPVGATTTITANGSSSSFFYQIKIDLPNYGIETMIVLAAIQDFPGFDCLIGRDILDNAILLYDGPAKQYTLEF